MKTTVIAPSNIAFIKYWGRKDEALRLPTNGSISMNLSNLLTTTTVEFSEDFKKDTIVINGVSNSNESNRVTMHLDRVRVLGKTAMKAKVVSKNNFPTSTGLSSSASGFAALTLAASASLGLQLSEKELSSLARLGSGSACRSIPDGFVQWNDGDTDATSYAHSLYPPEYWNIADIVAVVSQKPKEIPTSLGQQYVFSSPFFPKRLKNIKNKIRLIKQCMKQKDFEKFGELIEAEALEMHAIMMTSSPSLLYITPESLRVIQMVKKWRQEGLQVYFTLNTGQDVHIICEQKNVAKIQKLLGNMEDVKQIIVNYPGRGARLSNDHLF